MDQPSRTNYGTGCPALHRHSPSPPYHCHRTRGQGCLCSHRPDQHTCQQSCGLGRRQVRQTEVAQEGGDLGKHGVGRGEDDVTQATQRPRVLHTLPKHSLRTHATVCKQAEQGCENGQGRFPHAVAPA